jgi:hypothetical protein
MGRLKFEKGRAQKQLHQFPIPKEIYPDRFMLENLDEVKALRKRVKVLRDKIKFLEECLSRYTNYNGSSLGITAALEQVIHLFGNQDTEKPPQTDLDADGMKDLKTLLPQNQNAPAADKQAFANVQA